MDRTRSAPVSAAGMFEGFQIYPECIIELGDRSRENDGPARRVFLVPPLPT